MRFNLALITGASSGLGAELARQLAKRGVPLILSGRNGERLKGDVIVADLADPQGRAAVRCVIEERAPDLVILNAGFTEYGDCLDHLAVQSDILAVNAIAVHELSLAAAQVLKERGRPGVIVNISSAAALISCPAMATYGAAKAFVASFSRSFDAEMRPFGIRVLVALPGQIDTEFAARAAKNPQWKPSWMSMSVEKAARLVLKQIDRRQGYSVFDWKTRVAIFLSRFFPKASIERKFRDALLSRKETEL